MKKKNKTMKNVKARKLHTHTVSYVYIQEPAPAPVAPNVSVEMKDGPNGTYRLEVSGLAPQKAVAVAKYIIGIH